MYVGYFYAVRGAMGQEQRLDALAANLANANTPGFKQSKIAFDDYLIVTQKNDYTQGAVRQTERDLDLAIQGPGFFKVLTPRGEAYTRNGTFRTDREGNLLTGEGHRVLGLKGPINVGTGKEPVLVDNRGTVFKGQVEIDRLRVVDLPDKTNLQHQGGSLLVWTGQTPPQEANVLNAEILQGYLEEPNLRVATEMVHMIEAQRAFESYIKAIQSFQEADTRAITLVGRLR